MKAGWIWTAALAAAVAAGCCAQKCVCTKNAAPGLPLDDGFVPLFNGKDLTGWIGATDMYGVEKIKVRMSGARKDKEYAVLACFPERRKAGKGGGNLLTEKEYADFILRFEFCLPPNANNGLGIRVPSPDVDAAYHGMCELQILDDGGSKYTDLRPYQYHGSVYGIIPARRDSTGRCLKATAGNGSYLKPCGQWNFEEVRVIGSRIQVILNGEMIVDADVAGIKGDGTDTLDKRPHPGLHNRRGRIGWLGHGSHVQWRNIRIKEVPPDFVVGSDAVKTAPEGFETLFNGRDLTNWKGVTTVEKFDNPKVRQAATPEKRAEIQAIADGQMRDHWHVRDGALFFDGFKGGYSLATIKDYKDFEMYVDWRTLSVEGDSGLYLRGSPQVQIWDAHNQWDIGSGGLYNNKKNPDKALSIQDRQVGDWNTFHIVMRGERVTVDLNGVTVVNDTVLENYWDRSQPIFPVEQIELQCHGDPLEFRNIFIREL